MAPPAARFYGRRQGRKLRPGRAVLLAEGLATLAIALPQRGPIDLPALFAAPVAAFALEIGFGGGEHLVWQAERHPEIGYIGCEVFKNGLAAALAAIAQKRLANIRLYPEDARGLIERLPEASLDTIFLLFPDPWPKRRHRPRRFVDRDNLRQFARLLKDGGELRIASDDPGYVTWILAKLAQVPEFSWTAMRPADWQSRPADWPATRYEEKAIAAGRQPHFFRFRRRERAAEG